MEIPVLNRISCFGEANLSHHHQLKMNPSLISRVFHLMGIKEISIEIYNLWAWGALIFALIATFTGAINRTKLLIFRFISKGNSVISNPLLQPLFDEDDDDFSSSASSDEETEDEDDDEEEEEEENQEEHIDEDFRVAGSGNSREEKGQIRKRKMYRRRSSKNRFSWADLTNGKSVVKLWEGLGLGFESCSESVISLWDLNRNEITNTFFGGSNCQIPALTTISPAVIMSVGFEKGSERKAALRVWDSRTGRQIPEAIAEWIPHQRNNIVGIDSDTLGKVYVRDDVIGSSIETAIRDLRKIVSPLESCTEFDEKKRLWDWEEL